METPNDKLKFSFLFNNSNENKYYLNHSTNNKFNISPWSFGNRLKSSSYKKELDENINIQNILNLYKTNEKKVNYSVSSTELLKRKVNSIHSIHKIDVRASKFKINNINFDINFSYNEKSENKSSSTVPTFTRDIRVNLLKDLENLPEQTERKLEDSQLKEILSVKKKVFHFKREIKEEETDLDLESKVDYILNINNNMKKQLEKEKSYNSCKCKKTNCSKYSCNCLKNGVSCDLLCSCINCNNHKVK